MRGAIWPLVLAMLASGLSGAAACRQNDVSGRRVIVLGFDGMDYGVARDLMAKGRMPNFSRIAATGSLSALRTSNPAQSPVAWSGFITGQDPGQHGIFDFIHRDPETMVPYLSTTRTEAPGRNLAVGGWRLPLSNARVTLLRDGQPFWDVLERRGIPTTILRMPANYPPSGTATRELSGMGTPDILGSYGTFSFFTSAPGPLAERTVSGGVVTTVDVIDGVVRSELLGPENPFRVPVRKTSVPLTVYMDSREPLAKIVVGDEERVLKVGEWSDWVAIDYPLAPLQRLRGICRFLLKQTRPVFQLYVSPVNLDPMAPAMPISTPASYAGDLVHASGRFHTLGIAEDTKALSEHVLTRDEFLEQAASVLQETRRQYRSALEQFTGGLLFYHFGNLDQVSHMMWRARDPDHPAYDPIADAPYRSVVDDLYTAFDQIVGETLERMGADTTLIVMSDHGFTSWRRSFHLNSWLRDNGYLAVIDPGRLDDPGSFQNVDWSRTRAYGLGLNGLYVNVRGRERWGIVEASERSGLVEDIRRRLLGTLDPKTGHAIVTKASPREQIFADTRHFDVAPDLIIGYAEGTRVSNESALGGLPAGVVVDNTLEWSGDHSMDPDTVPGMILSNRPLRGPVGSIDQVARAILAEFDAR